MIPQNIVLILLRVLHGGANVLIVCLVVLGIAGLVFGGFGAIFALLAFAVAPACLVIRKWSLDVGNMYLRGDAKGVQSMRFFGVLLIVMGLGVMIAIMDNAYPRGGGAPDEAARILIYVMTALTALGVVCTLAAKPAPIEKRPPKR